MSTLFVKKGRDWGAASFLSFDLFFNQIKFLITFGRNEIMPLKSFQMELAKGLLLNSASILVPIKCLLLKGMPAWWSYSKAQGALLPTLPFQVLLRDFSPGWAGRLLSLGGSANRSTGCRLGFIFRLGTKCCLPLTGCVILGGVLPLWACFLSRALLAHKILWR